MSLHCHEDFGLRALVCLAGAGSFLPAAFATGAVQRLHLAVTQLVREQGAGGFYAGEHPVQALALMQCEPQDDVCIC